MALLPLAGWAENYSGWTVTLSENSSAYTGLAKNVTVTLRHGDEDPVTITNGVDGWTLAWTKGGNPATLVEVGEYTLTVSNGTTHTAPTANTANYEITQAENSISGLALADWTYGAAPNTPSYTAAFGTPTFTYSTSATGDYDTYANVVAGQAGTYYVKASIAATANYEAATSEPVQFTIKKATLLVRAVSETIFYGQAPTLAIAYDGFENGENAASLEAEVDADADDDITEANYWKTPTLAAPGTDAKATPYDMIPTGGFAKNYKFAYVGGKLTINKAKVQIVAQDATETYGTDPAGLTSWTAKSTDTNPYFKVYVQNGWDGTDPTKATYSTTAATTTDILNVKGGTGADKNDYKNLTVTRAEGTAVNTTTGYAINVAGGDFKDNYEAGEYKAGKFTITKGALTFELKNFSKIYGEDDPENWQADYTMKMNGTAITTDPDGVKSKITVARVAGETAGSYDITLTVADKESFTNFTITEPEDPSVFFIERAPLTIVAKPQALYVGNKVDKLVQTEYTMTGLVKNITVNDVTINDAATVSLVFGTENNTDETLVPVWSAADEEADATHVAGALKEANVFAKGIKVVLAEQTALAANYNITLTNGALTVTDLTTAIALSFAADNTDALETADGTDIKVSFGAKELKVGEWYAMVLPFDVDPLKMVNAFDRYVIFNELNKATTTASEFKFTLTMNTIPAGTPFLIKFAPKSTDVANTVVNMNEFNTNTYGVVTISKDIVPVVTDHVIFTGTYEAGEVLQGYKESEGIGEKVWWLGNSTLGKKNTWLKPKNNPRTLDAMEAYLTAEGKDWTSYAPTITVEDFDGSVTAIKSINADQIHGLNVKGMYNLNGMKMNNVPTQKGIYIINGKKVVIK